MNSHCLPEQGEAFSEPTCSAISAYSFVLVFYRIFWYYICHGTKEKRTRIKKLSDLRQYLLSKTIFLRSRLYIQKSQILLQEMCWGGFQGRDQCKDTSQERCIDEVRWEVRLLWRKSDRISLSRSYQQRWSKTQERNRAIPSLQVGRRQRISKVFANSLLQLQYGKGLLWCVPS